MGLSACAKRSLMLARAIDELREEFDGLSKRSASRVCLRALGEHLPHLFRRDPVPLVLVETERVPQGSVGISHVPRGSQHVGERAIPVRSQLQAAAAGRSRDGFPRRGGGLVEATSRSEHARSIPAMRLELNASPGPESSSLAPAKPTSLGSAPCSQSTRPSSAAALDSTPRSPISSSSAYPARSSVSAVVRSPATSSLQPGGSSALRTAAEFPRSR